MTVLAVFESAEWSVRALDLDGEPWFVASDVAKALGYRDAANMTRRLDPDELRTHSVSTSAGDRNATVINEAGLYSAILGSHIDGAKAFKRWVTHEVLPAIRRTGTYSTAPALPPVPTLAEALEGWLGTVKELETTKAELAEAAPKVAAYDQFLDADGCLTMQQTAHAVGLGRTTLFRRLREVGVLQANNLPYQRYAHHFDIVLGTHQQNGQDVLHSTTRVKASGVEFIARKLAVQSARLALVPGGVA